MKFISESVSDEACFNTLFASESLQTITHKNGLKRKKSTVEEEFWLDDVLERIYLDNSDTGSICVDKDVPVEQSRKKRTKWSTKELFTLWSGIALYGNEWIEIQKHLNLRSYPQVKDKGRRLLRKQNWKTGKTKRDTDIAYVAAKRIACEMLKANGFVNRNPYLPSSIGNVDDFTEADLFDDVLSLFVLKDESNT